MALRRHYWKGAAIRNTTWALLLDWGEVHVAASTRTSIRKFLRAADRLLASLKSQSQLIAWVMAVEYAPTNSEYMRPHVHLFVILGPTPRLALATIKHQWTSRGGQVRSTAVHEGGLESAMKYVDKGAAVPCDKAGFKPTGKRKRGFDYSEVERLRKLILPIEQELGRPAAFVRAGGLALSAAACLPLQARARLAMLEEEGRVIPDDDLDLPHEDDLLSLKVCGVRVCRSTSCFKYGKGVQRNGKPQGKRARWRCTHCGASWPDEAVSAGDARRRRRQAIDREILQRWKEGLGYRDIATATKSSRDRVQRVVGSYKQQSSAASSPTQQHTRPATPGQYVDVS